MEKDWSNISKNFDELQKYIVGENTDRLIKEHLSSKKELGNVLEFGCGNGNYTKVIAPNANSILATDISDSMVEQARANLGNFSNIKVEKANCYATNFEDDSYDTIFMANVIHVVNEPKKVLQEAHRLLKPDGKLIVVSFTKDGLSFINKILMIYRYLKTFGKPPKSGTPFGLQMLKDFINNNNFETQEAQLIGDHQSKAMFIISKRV